MSKKPVVAAAEAKTLADQVTDVIIINGQKLIPVEASSYRTVDFREEQNLDAILYSGGLSKCLAVLIKNKGAEGKYDMMHFFS